MRMERIEITTDGAGAATVVSTAPLSGYLVELRCDGAALTAGGTADFTFSRKSDGGTILALTDAEAPWQYSPRQTEHTTAGGSIGADAKIPVDDYVQVVIAQAAPNAQGVIYVHVEEDSR